MAILSKIRERSTVLILIIGLALFAFVASPYDIMSMFESKKQNYIGQINGESINRFDFERQVEFYRTNNGRNISQLQASNTVWDNIVREKVYASEFEKAGIFVQERDVWEAIINNQEIQSVPQFRDESGLFDQEKLKEYILSIKDEAGSGNADLWNGWLSYEFNIQEDLKQKVYENLVESGLGVSLKQAKDKYLEDNTYMDVKYGYVSYGSVKDDKVNITDAQIQEYIDKHHREFQVDNSRNLSIVQLKMEASSEDIEAIKKELLDLTKDKEEYSSIEKKIIKVKGLANSDEPVIYANDYSDLKNTDSFIFEDQLPIDIAKTLFSLPINAIYGPYKQDNYYKISRVLAKERVNQVRASHILISYKGAQNANPIVERTKDQAKQRANEILAKAKKKGSDFAVLSREESDGPSASNGGDLGWFGSGQMALEFEEFAFKNRKGSIGMVETPFGFHVVKVTGNRSKQGIKLASIARLIEPSEQTENKAYREAEILTSQISNGNDISELAEDKGYTVEHVKRVKALQENIPSLGNQREIIAWAFDKNTSLGSVKRFDLNDKGYAVVVLDGITKKGTASVEAVKDTVKPILVNQSKAKILQDKLNGTTVEEIALANNVELYTDSRLTIENPTLSGIAGYEPLVVGAMFVSPVDKVVSHIVGGKGVFFFTVTKRQEPSDIDNYTLFARQLETQNRVNSFEIFEALKHASNIKDYRADFY